jgi:hypothetical protein
VAVRKLLGFVGFLLMLEGVAGLVFHFVGWFRLWTFVHYIDFLKGYEIVANIALIVIGFVIAVASDKIKT